MGRTECGAPGWPRGAEHQLGLPGSAGSARLGHVAAEANRPHRVRRSELSTLRLLSWRLGHGDLVGPDPAQSFSGEQFDHETVVLAQSGAACFHGLDVAFDPCGLGPILLGKGPDRSDFSSALGMLTRHPDDDGGTARDMDRQQDQQDAVHDAASINAGSKAGGAAQVWRKAARRSAVPARTSAEARRGEYVARFPAIFLIASASTL